MTSNVVPAGGDPRRLLADARTLAHRVRVAQRVTWLPLLVLALVTFGAIPVTRWAAVVVRDCQSTGDGQVCRVWTPAAQLYWLAILAVAYLVIAAGYRRVARTRGLGTRVLPYVITGIGLAVLITAAATVLNRLDALGYPREPSALTQAVFRLIDFTGTIGLALLVLAWLERHVALLVFTLAYLTVVLVPINFGWGEHWGSRWGFAPMLVISGGVLLLGSAGFALAQRRRGPR